MSGGEETGAELTGRRRISAVAKAGELGRGDVMRGKEGEAGEGETVVASTSNQWGLTGRWSGRGAKERRHLAANVRRGRGGSSCGPLTGATETSFQIFKDSNNIRKIGNKLSNFRKNANNIFMER